MFDDTTLGPRVLANPSMLLYTVIQELQSRLGGDVVIPDANNAFTLLLDASSSMTSQFVRQEDARYEMLYKARAQTAEELYPFLSDYDYVSLMASPASLQFRLILDKNWVVANAVDYDDTHSRLVIPDTTKIKLGNRYFSLYYPIQIMVNKTSQVVDVTYDIETVNPLKSFSTNMLDSVSEYTYSGIDFLDMVFDAWQFATSVYNEQAVLETGFSKSYPYTDQFYAARVYTYLNGSWQELAYSMSTMVYDTSTPTAIISPYTDTSTVKIYIPQIYFTSGLVGQQLKVVLFTTEGEISATIAQADASGTQINFDTTSSIYSAPLALVPSLEIIPYNTTSIKGGSNPMSFSDFRKAVIGGTLYTEAPISNLQLNAAVEKYGYTLYKYLDNITDRLLFAGAALQFTDGSAVPTVSCGVTLNDSYLNGDPSTILTQTDGLVTILPSTIFKYDASTNLSRPITNAETTYLQNLPTASLVTELNTNRYTRQPFHVVLDTNNKYPVAKTFNLMTPTMTSLIFNNENVSSAAQLSVTNAVITHLNSGTGGYQVRIGVKRSAALSSADPTTDMKILFYTTDKTGVRIHFEATYVNSVNGIDVYEIIVPTSYHITVDGYISSTALDTNNNTFGASLALSSTFDIRLAVLKTIDPTVEQSSILSADVEPQYTANWLIVAQQTMGVMFGEDMSSLLYNIVTTTWGTEVYDTYTADVYKTYNKDQYLFNADGTLASQITTDPTTNTKSLTLVKLFNDGDQILTGTDFSITVSTSQLIPTATVAVSSVAHIRIGTPVSGAGVSVGTTVKAIDTVNNTITLSAIPSVITAGTTYIVQNRITTTSVTTAQAQAGVTVVLADVTYCVVGMTVVGLNIPTGTTLQAIDASTSTITLSQATTAALSVGTTLYIYDASGPVSKLHSAGDIKLDIYGNKVTVKSRSNVYTVQMPQIDARLYASEDVDDVAYVESIPSLISTNAHVLDTVRSNMFERTELYYKPYKTLGSSTFGIGDNVTMTLDLGLSFSVVYYMTQGILDNTSLTAQIKEQTISLISEYVVSQSVSISDIFDLLKTNFAGNIVSLDVLGINNDPALQTIVVQENEAVPSVARILAQDVDGSLVMTPDITVTFKLAAS